MDTLLFSVGIFIFMITVYGALVAGGVVLRRKQVSELAGDLEIISGDNGVDVLVGSESGDSERGSN